MLAVKLAAVFVACGCWLAIAYIQSRVWGELPTHIQQESHVVLPVYGCKECTSTAVSSDMSVFLCNGCKQNTNNSNNNKNANSITSSSRAAMKTAYLIGNEVEWIVGGDFWNRVFVNFVYTVAQKPGAAASWMLWVQVCICLVVAVWRVVVECKHSLSQFKVQEGTLVPMQSMYSLPTSLHDILKGGEGGEEGEEEEEESATAMFSRSTRRKFL